MRNIQVNNKQNPRVQQTGISQQQTPQTPHFPVGVGAIMNLNIFLK